MARLVPGGRTSLRAGVPAVAGAVPCRRGAQQLAALRPCGRHNGGRENGFPPADRYAAALRPGDMRCRTVRTGPKRYGVRSQRVRADRSGAASDRQRPPRPAPSRNAMDASTAPLHRRCLSPVFRRRSHQQGSCSLRSTHRNYEVVSEFGGGGGPSCLLFVIILSRQAPLARFGDEDIQSGSVYLR